jgi:hypothetical protein
MRKRRSWRSTVDCYPVTGQRMRKWRSWISLRGWVWRVGHQDRTAGSWWRRKRRQRTCLPTEVQRQWTTIPPGRGLGNESAIPPGRGQVAHIRWPTRRGPHFKLKKKRNCFFFFQKFNPNL